MKTIKLKGVQPDLFEAMADTLARIDASLARIEENTRPPQLNPKALLCAETVAHRHGAPSATYLNQLLAGIGVIYCRKNRKGHILRWEVGAMFAHRGLFRYVDIPIERRNGHDIVTVLRFTPKGDKFACAILGSETCSTAMAVYKQTFPEEF